MAEKRKYFRVEAKIPLEIHLVPEEERKDLRCEILKTPAPSYAKTLPANQDDWDLIDWMKVLNEKLDILVARGGPMDAASNPLAASKPSYVNISAGGMAFLSAKAFKLGDLVSVKTALPTAPPLSLLLYGKVVLCQKIRESFKLGVEFAFMSSDIRQEIANFVLNREREGLRDGLK